METYLTVEQAYSYGITLQKARRLAPEERRHYRPEYQDTMFIALGDGIKLPEVKWEDMPKRADDGSFPGCGNRAWIITQEEWDTYVELNAHRSAAKKSQEIQTEIAYLESVKAKAECQHDIPSKGEAAKRLKQWNDIYNEGGEGYLPEIITTDRYAYVCARLEKLKEQLQEI